MLTILVPILLAAPQDPQGQPKTVTEYLPLQQICTVQRDHPTTPWATLLRFRQPDERRAHLVHAGAGDDGIDADSIVDSLYSFEQEAVDEERLFLQPFGQNLLVVGQNDVVQRVKRRLDEATRILARPLQVEFAIWDAADREAPAAVLDPNAYAKFAANSKPLWKTIGTGRSGHVIPLEHMTWSRYVRSLEVEVAQKMTLSRPATDRYGEGGHAIVRAYSLIGCDDYAVHAQFAVAKRRGIVRSLQTGMPGAAEIELPRLESFFGGCSGRIPNGGALAATMRGNAATGGQLVITLRVVSNSPPAVMSGKDVALLPCGALSTGSLMLTPQLPDLHSDGSKQVAFDEQSVYGYVPTENLVELAEGILESAEQLGDYGARMAGDHLYVRGNPETVARVESMLRGLQERLVRNVAIHHLGQLQALQGEGAPDAARPLLHSLTLPSLLGREAVAYRLLETNVVANVFIEIAQEASTLVPSVERLQSGTWFRSRAVPLDGSMHVDLNILSASAPTPPMRSVMPGGGILMQADISTSRLEHDGIVDRGATIVHGDGPSLSLEGRSYRSSLSTTFRR